MSELKRRFGKNIKFIRKAKGLTQEKLAEMLNLNQRQLTRIESGANFPSVDTLANLCIQLDTPINQLFDFELPLDDTMLATGTEGRVYYKAIRSGNIVKLENISKKDSNAEEKNQEIDAGNTAASMTNIAKKLNKPITVEYIENGNSYIATYLPDGTIKDSKNSEKVEKEEAEREKMVSQLIKRFRQIAYNKSKLNFINLALDAMDNKTSLNKLKTLIEGMELTLKN